MTTSEISSATSGGPRGVSRLLSKLKNSMDQGEYYEAHQMYRTLYFRYTTQKAYNECLELLFSGAAKLLTKQEQSSAADLCLLLVDTLEKRDTTNNIDNNEWIQRLGTLIGGLGANIVERETLIQRAIKWSGTAFGNSYGHPSLHKMIAQVFWKERNIEQARHHFLLSQDGNLCGRILVQISESKGFVSEVDLFIVQAVLQILCLKDPKTAEDTFTAYTTHHPQILRKTRPFKQPLLNFLYFLFRLIDMKTLTTFCVLRKLYEPSLNRDPSFLKYLSKIGTIYFDEVPVGEASGSGIMGGMFGDIFSRLLQGFEDDDDGDEASTTARRPDTHANAELD